MDNSAIIIVHNSVITLPELVENPPLLIRDLRIEGGFSTPKSTDGISGSDKLLIYFLICRKGECLKLYFVFLVFVTCCVLLNFIREQKRNFHWRWMVIGSIINVKNTFVLL